MEPTSHFWPNFWSAATAVGTIGAVVVALFGNWLRAHLTPPKLTLRLKDERGTKTPVTITAPSDGSQRQTEGRWYHATVENRRRWSPAHGVQVFLLRLEEPDAAGEDQVTWVGSIPLRWRHQEIHPLALLIGPSEECDLCSVIRDKWVELHPLIVPHALNHRRGGKCQLIVILQARSVEADFNLLRVRIAWDGVWSDDADEMAHHMVVRQL